MTTATEHNVSGWVPQRPDSRNYQLLERLPLLRFATPPDSVAPLGRGNCAGWFRAFSTLLCQSAEPAPQGRTCGKPVAGSAARRKTRDD